MGIRWEDYKNRRSLSLSGWAGYYGIKNYEDMQSHLLNEGIIPPDRFHEDVLLILGQDGLVVEKDPEPPVEESAVQEEKNTKPAKEKPAPKRKPRVRRTTKKKSPAKSSKK